MKAGTWGWDGCGATSQNSASAHLHWILPSDAITVDGWTIDYPDSTWRRNGETRSPGYPYDLLTSTNTPNEGGGPSCSNPNSDQVTLYVRPGFDSNGQCITKGIGEYRQPGDIGLPNDSIQSIKVGSNVRARLCQHADFGEPCEWFDSDNGDLRNTSVGSGTSSVKVELKPRDCNPSANEVALYVRPGFDANGECIRKGIGEYRHPGDIGLPNDSIHSIKVGSNVRARLCQHADFGEPCEWFDSDNGDLRNTSVGSGTSSVKVEGRPPIPVAPELLNPANGYVFSRSDSVTLSWGSAEFAYDYLAELWGGPSGTLTSGWTQGQSWYLGQLWGGTYYWHVKSGNGAGGASDWSGTRSFAVKYGRPTNLSASAVSSSEIELSWSASADAPGNIDGYRIYRGGVAITTVGSSVTTYRNAGLDCSSTYSYVVKAYKGNAESDASNTATTTLPQCVPTCQPGPDGIILYQGTNYRGQCITLTGNTDDLTYVSFDNAVSSVQFVGAYANAGWQAALFSDANYGGAYKNFSVNDPDLSNDLGNGQASSFRLWHDGDDNRRLFLGRPVDGTIQVPNDSDAYWFYGTAGQRVTIKMNKQAGGLDSYLMLYGPNWGLVARDDDSGGDSNALMLNVQLWATGQHYLYARSYAGQSAGAYQLQVQCSPGANGIVLYEGISHTGRCVTLTGNAADLATLSFNDAVSSIKFAGSYANAGWQVGLFADANYGGSYKNYGGNDHDLSNDLGNRRASSFRLWRDSDDNRRLLMGQSLNGTIHVPNDSDGYWFYGTAGQRVTITMNKQVAGLDSYLILYGPYWGVVAQNDDGGGDRNALIYNVQLWATGTHHLYARSFAGQSAGGYTVTLSPGQ